MKTPNKWPILSNPDISDWLASHLQQDGHDSELFAHQAVVRRFLSADSPYRGILLYHAVGTGKTRTALTVAETAAAVGKKDVVVLLPAFLHQNFEDEIKKYKKTNEFTFIHYNGLSAATLSQYEHSNPFDGKVVVIDEVHILTTMAVGAGFRGSRLYRLLVNAQNVRIIALSATPLVNRPHELAYLVGLIKGYARLFRLQAGEKLSRGTSEQIQRTLEADAEVDQVEVEPRTGLVCFTRVPTGFFKVEPRFVSASGDASEDHVLLDRITSSLSAQGISAGPLDADAAAKLPDVVVPLPLSAEAFDELFIDHQEQSLIHRATLVKRILGCISYFEHYDDRYPRVNPTHFVKLSLTETQWRTYEKIRFDERKMEASGQRFGGDKQKKDVFQNDGNVYRAFSRALCNFAFPSDIVRPWPSTVKAMQKESELEDIKLPATSHLKDKEYQRLLAEALTKLEANSTKYLSGPGLRELSPKFVSVIKRSAAAPGPVLLYSQFRSVEGVGIMKLALNAAGWSEFDLDKVGGSWKVKAVENGNGRRYITFDDDKKKTDILKAVFNDDLDNAAVPENIRTAVRALSKDQAHGAIIKMLMITERGATGISLRNVRQVHVLEPFWNSIRMSQVVGRAVRADSHAGLPLSERIVDVFYYITHFTPQQLKDSFTIRTLDRSQTTDEYILGVAQRKSKIMDQILGAMKSAAFDCTVHAAEHTDVTCHAASEDDAPPAFDVQTNVKREDGLSPKKKLPTTVHATYKGRTYAFDPATKVLYDLAAYKRGVLVIKGRQQPDGQVRLY